MFLTRIILDRTYRFHKGPTIYICVHTNRVNTYIYVDRPDRKLGCLQM